MDRLHNATLLGNVPLITSSFAWLYLGNSNWWILFICWLLGFHLITHTEHGGKFPQAGGHLSGCQTQRGVLEQRDRDECRREAAQRHNTHAVATNTFIISYSITWPCHLQHENPDRTKHHKSSCYSSVSDDASVTLMCAEAHQWGWRLVAEAACWPGLAGSGTCWGWRRWQQLHCSSPRWASLVAAAWHLPVEPGCKETRSLGIISRRGCSVTPIKIHCIETHRPVWSDSKCLIMSVRQGARWMLLFTTTRGHCSLFD